MLPRRRQRTGSPPDEHVIDAWPPAILLVVASLIAIIVWGQLARC